MATSNSVNFKLKRDQLIVESYAEIGVGVGGEPIDADLINAAAIRLNIMIKAWQAYGIKLWKRNEKAITLINGQSRYTLGQKSAGTATTDSLNKLVDLGANFITDEIEVGDTVYNITDNTNAAVTSVDSTTTLSFASDLFPDGDEDYEISNANVSVPRPLTIIECNRKDTSGHEVTMELLTKNEYDALSNKSSPGTPVNYHYDPTLNNGTFDVWPTPDANAATNYTVDIIYNSPLEDMDASTDDFDFSQEWYEPLMYGLAYRLGPTHGLAASERSILRQDMNDSIELARNFDVEDGSVLMQVELR